ncbi:MAG: exodeoxyribonuclease III [Minicystis sp.]
MRVLSWNVNGLRSVIDKGFRRWLSRSGAAIVGLQEVRAREDQLADHKRVFTGWSRHLVSAERPGYSGVALLAKKQPDAVTVTLGDPIFDVEGRFQLARFGKLVVVNAYFPNGNGPARDNSRIPYKLAFYRRVFESARAREGARRAHPGDGRLQHRAPRHRFSRARSRT